MNGSKVLSALDSVAAMKITKGKSVKEPQIVIDDAEVVRLRKQGNQVRDGKFQANKL